MRKTLIIAGTLLVAILLVLGACVPTPPPPVRPKPLPPPTPAPLPSPAPEKSSTNIIKDLAYIKALGILYSDDADPESEGIDIHIAWYDTKSEDVHFRNIPMLVTIELFTAKYNVEVKQREIVRSVYKAEAQIDSSLSRVRIPFKDINVDPNADDCSGIGKVTVHTPQQGDFSFDMEYVLLYEPD